MGYYWNYFGRRTFVSESDEADHRNVDKEDYENKVEVGNMFLTILILIMLIAVTGSWIIVEAVTAAAGTVSEPLVTWNLYVAPAISTLSTALILIFINRRFSSVDKKDDRIASLLAEKEQQKEQAVRERWTKFDGTICNIKNMVEEIKEDMHKKVPFPYCDDREKEIKKDLDDLEKRIREVEK